MSLWEGIKKATATTVSILSWPNRDESKLVLGNRQPEPVPSMSDVENDISRLNFLGGGEVCRARTFRSVPTDVAAAAADDDDNLAPSTSREERETESLPLFRSL